MSNYKQKYLNATTSKELNDIHVFQEIMKLSFIEKLSIIKDLIALGPKTKFDFYKIEALVKYISLDNPFEVIIAIKYALRELEKYEYHQNSKEYQNILNSLETYKNEMAETLKIATSFDWYYNLNKINYNYHYYVSLSKDEKELNEITEEYNYLNTLIESAKKDKYFPNIIAELTKITFYNRKYDQIIISTIEAYLGKEKTNNILL